MRNIILTTGLLLLGLNLIKAQNDELKPFRIEVGGRLGASSGGYWGDELYTGYSFYMEPKYQLTNRYALGLLIEGDLFSTFGYDGLYFRGHYPRILLTGDYYYKIEHEKNKASFAGIGLGPIVAPYGETNPHFILRTGHEKSSFRLTVSIGLTVNTRKPYLNAGISFGYVFRSKKK